MKYDTQQLKIEWIPYLKDFYKDNKQELFQLGQLNEFKLTYSPNDAIQWYTRGICLNRLLNEGIRVKNI